MGYSDQKFHSRPLQLWAQAVDVGLSVATTVAETDVAKSLPKLIRKSQINALRFRCDTIPNASATVLSMSALNGTDTIGAITITTATADQHFDMTISTANNVMAADGQVTISITGTATATDDDLGNWDIWAEIQEEFV